MTTLEAFWDNMIPYGTESAHFFVLMNSATKLKFRIRVGIWVEVSGLGLSSRSVQDKRRLWRHLRFLYVFISSTLKPSRDPLSCLIEQKNSLSKTL